MELLIMEKSAKGLDHEAARSTDTQDLNLVQPTLVLTILAPQPNAAVMASVTEAKPAIEHPVSELIKCVPRLVL